MIKECPFDFKNCDIWIDYQIACVSLQEAEEFCSSYRKEINYLMNRVKLLEELLINAGINIPE